MKRSVNYLSSCCTSTAWIRSLHLNALRVVAWSWSLKKEEERQSRSCAMRDGVMACRVMVVLDVLGLRRIQGSHDMDAGHFDRGMSYSWARPRTRPGSYNIPYCLVTVITRNPLETALFYSLSLSLISCSRGLRIATQNALSALSTIGCPGRQLTRTLRPRTRTQRSLFLLHAIWLEPVPELLDLPGGVHGLAKTD